MIGPSPRRLLFATPHTGTELIVYVLMIVPAVLAAHAVAGMWAGAAAAFVASLVAAAVVSHRRRRK